MVERKCSGSNRENGMTVPFRTLYADLPTLTLARAMFFLSSHGPLGLLHLGMKTQF